MGLLENSSGDEEVSPHGEEWAKLNPARASICLLPNFSIAGRTKGIKQWGCRTLEEPQENSRVISNLLLLRKLVNITVRVDFGRVAMWDEPNCRIVGLCLLSDDKVAAITRGASAVLTTPAAAFPVTFEPPGHRTGGHSADGVPGYRHRLRYRRSLSWLAAQSHWAGKRNRAQAAH